jgi:hypothetical protein
VVGVIEDISPPDFFRDALCAEVDPEIFFPEKGGSTKAAKRVCAACTVQQECLESSLTVYVYGTWDGTSERERRQIRRDRNINPRWLGSNVNDINYRPEGFPCRLGCDAVWSTPGSRAAHERFRHQRQEQAS